MNISDRQRVFFTAWVLFLGAAFARVALWWRNRGVVTTPDSGNYVSNCGPALSDPIGVALGTTEVAGMVGIEKISFQLPFCVVMAATDSLKAWVAVQILLSALTCVLLYLAGRRLFSPAAGLLAGGLFAVLYDSFRYTIIVLTETTFLFTIALAVWAFARYFDRRTRGSKLGLYAALVLVATTRPYGVPFLIGWVLWDLLPEDSPMRPGFTFHRGTVLAIVGAAGTAVVLFTDRIQWIVQDAIPNMTNENVFWEGNQPMPIPEFPLSITETGSVLDFLVGNGLQIAFLGLYRVAVLYWPVMPYLTISPVWLTVHLVTYGLMLGFGILGLIRLFRERRRAFAVLLVPVLVSTLIVAVTHVDYSWRLRLPIEPTFAVAAGYGVTSVDSIQARLNWLADRIPLFGPELRSEAES